VKTGAVTEQKLFTFYRLSNDIVVRLKGFRKYWQSVLFQQAGLRPDQIAPMVLSLYFDLMTLCFYLLATQDESQLGEAHQLSIALPEVTAGNGTFLLHVLVLNFSYVFSDPLISYLRKGTFEFLN